jgi:hypothetical protein
VPKSRQGQFQRASSPARRRLSFEHIHLHPGLRQNDRRRQPIRTSADYARATDFRDAPRSP